MNFDSPAFRSSLLGLLVRRLPLVLGFAALGALAGLALSGSVGDENPEYESRTLVVATTWDLRIEGLPRMVETVVETNGFRRELERTDADVFAGAADFDDSVEVVPVQDTVAVWLEARASTPELAQRRANLAGEVLVNELNRLGTDIGTFVVQDRGSLPVAPLGAALSLPLMFALGALGGLTIGSGLAVAWPDPEGRSVSTDRVSASESAADDVAANATEQLPIPMPPEIPTIDDVEAAPHVREHSWPGPAAEKHGAAEKYGPPRHRSAMESKL